MMEIILGKTRTENDKIERIPSQRFLNPMPTNGRRHMMSCLLHHSGLSGQHFFIALTVKNLDRGLGRRSGQVSSP
jgi:hypothetical protein